MPAGFLSPERTRCSALFSSFRSIFERVLLFFLRAVVDAPIERLLDARLLDALRFVLVGLLKGAVEDRTFETETTLDFEARVIFEDDTRWDDPREASERALEEARKAHTLHRSFGRVNVQPVSAQSRHFHFLWPRYFFRNAGEPNFGLRVDFFREDPLARARRVFVFRPRCEVFAFARATLIMVGVPPEAFIG